MAARAYLSQIYIQYICHKYISNISSYIYFCNIDNTIKYNMTSLALFVKNICLIYLSFGWYLYSTIQMVFI